MKSAPSRNGRLQAILSLACLGCLQAQTQAPPAVTYDPFNDVLQLDWQSTRNRTFFPQASVDLNTWDYIGELYFGPGSHNGTLQTNAAKAFFRLQYSDLPVDTEAEAGTADFDLDGLQNLAELQESHTDPLRADTDRDGLPDGWEVAHSISPLDDGSIDPVNGPDGIFPDDGSGPTELSLMSSGITNVAAYAAGVAAIPTASLSDLDGDGVPNPKDAGPLSTAIDWEANGAPARFAFVELPGYNFSLHGAVVGCNGQGDVIAGKAIYVGGAWHTLAQVTTGSPNFLPMRLVVDGRVHDIYVKSQPLPTSVSDDGRIVGTATVYFEPVEEEAAPNLWVSYQPEPTTLAFVWNSWTSTPRPLAHSMGSAPEGNFWNESPQIAPDGTVVIRRKASTTSATGNYRLDRYTSAGVQSTLGYPSALPSKVGSGGFVAFNMGSPNAYSWLPGAPPVSLLADSLFSTPNPRSSFSPSAEPTFIGEKPGLPGGYCLNFWNKVVIRHGGKWREAMEMGDATLVTTKGIAFRARAPEAVQVWKGGGTTLQTLNEAVPNKDFSSLYTYFKGSTADGRVLINYLGAGQNGYGFLIPYDIKEVISDQIVGNEANKLPTAFYGGHPNNPMLMATRYGANARLAIKMDVPAAYASSIRVGARVAGTTSILGSVTAVAPPGLTMLDFTALSGSKTYEIVAGYDDDGDGVLDDPEASLIFQKTPKTNNPVMGGGAYTGSAWNLVDKIIIVTYDDFVSARQNTEDYGSGSVVSTFYPTAADLVSAFAQGANTISGSSPPEFGALLDASTIPSTEGLSHPLGGKWNAAKQTNSHRLVLPSGSDLSEDVVGSQGLRDMYARVLYKYRATIAAAATSSWGVVMISFTDNDVDFATSDQNEQVHVALGKCKCIGSLEVSVKAKPGGGFDVGALNCFGAMVDLYDFAYGAPRVTIAGVTMADPKEAARTQAGYATLAFSPWPEAGRVFYTKVEFGTGWFDYTASYAP